jgi:DNA-binding CsgD family transcriptional regulator
MAATPAVLTEPWPLTGRHEDLELIADALVDGARAVFLVGEAGTGKTRLAREVLRRLAADGVPTAGATASESSAGTPLGALAHLVPSGAIDSPPTVFAATREALVERTGGRSLVLHVDDAHHLDPTSAALLVGLAEAAAVQLICTLRPGGRGPDALGALQAGDRSRTVLLGALDPLAIDALLHRVLGGPLDGVAEAQLLHTSGGNPLYLRELVLGALANGTLTEVAGVWRLDGSFPTTEALGDRVLGRMAGLGDAARDALELVAISEPIGLALLEELVDPIVLEELESRALLRVEDDRRRHEVRLGHPVYGEILRASIGRVRLRRLSRTIVEAVERHGGRRAEDPARIVRWQIDAGIAPDVEVVMAGTRLARHHQDWSSMAALATAALAAGHADAAAFLVEARYALGEFAEGDEVADGALARADELGEEALVLLHRARAESLFFSRDDAAGAVAAVRGLLPQVRDEHQRELLTFSQSAILAWSGRVREAAELIATLDASERPIVVVQADMIHELLGAVVGPVGPAIELADDAFARHVAIDDLNGTNSPGFHLVIKTLALTNAGRLEEAAALAEAGYGSSVADRLLAGQLWFSLELGRIALLRGDAVNAARWYREQVALCRATGWRRPITLGLSGLAVAEAHRGDAEAAVQAIAERDATGYTVIELFALEGARGTAWARWAAGDPVGARSVLLAAVDDAEAAGIALMAALARIDLLRLGAADQAAPLAAAAEHVDSRLVELGARWAASTNDGAALEEVGAGFEALGALMLAAESTASAADAWKRSGEQRRGVSAQRRAEELVARCRGVAAPTLAVVETVVPLTAREREIARLVADGLTSKEVAERLFVSARTVSNHLQNAYTKLGISKRTELAAALGRAGEPGGAP